jgi:hypothetical protein
MLDGNYIIEMGWSKGDVTREFVVREFEEESGKEMTIKPKLPSPSNWGTVKPGGPNDFTKFGGYKLAKPSEYMQCGWMQE